jgi:hypothetical protein
MRKNDGNPDIEGAIRHVYLQSRLANGGHVLLVDVNERHIVPGARESAADDSADGSGADDDHARAHVNLLDDFTKTSQRYWKRAGASMKWLYSRAERGLEVAIDERNQSGSSD